MSSQCERYRTYSNQIQKASKEKKDIVILTDENIEMSDDYCTSHYLKNISIKEMRDKIIIDFSLTYHNKKSTFLGNESGLV